MVTKNKFLCWLLNLQTVNTLSSGTKFIIQQGNELVNITWADLLTNLNIYAEPVESRTIVEVNADYPMTGDECVIICHSGVTPIVVTLVDGTTFPKTVTIRAIGGDVTLVTTDSQNIENSVMSDGSSFELVYAQADNVGWFEI